MVLFRNLSEVSSLVHYCNYNVYLIEQTKIMLQAILKQNFSFFTRLSTAEAHVCGVKFIGLYGTVGFIAIRDFSF